MAPFRPGFSVQGLIGQESLSLLLHVRPGTPRSFAYQYKIYMHQKRLSRGDKEPEDDHQVTKRYVLASRT
jgi:hypothetical protein